VPAVLRQRHAKFHDALLSIASHEDAGTPAGKTALDALEGDHE
jgi:hypothetical protein